LNARVGVIRNTRSVRGIGFFNISVWCIVVIVVFIANQTPLPIQILQQTNKNSENLLVVHCKRHGQVLPHRPQHEQKSNASTYSAQLLKNNLIAKCHNH
jgi:hypothetical protein